MRARIALVAALLALLAAGCGGGSGSSSGSSSNGGTLTVFAASSLTDAFTKLGTSFQSQHPGWKVRFEFLGSDQLAAQIEQGDPADVYAAASTKYPSSCRVRICSATPPTSPPTRWCWRCRRTIRPALARCTTSATPSW